jgi:hypothetical protein
VRCLVRAEPALACAAGLVLRRCTGGVASGRGWPCIRHYRRGGSARAHWRVGQRQAECEQRPGGHGQSDDGHYCRPHPPLPQAWPRRDPLSHGHGLVADQPGKDDEQRSETGMVRSPAFSRSGRGRAAGWPASSSRSPGGRVWPPRSGCAFPGRRRADGTGGLDAGLAADWPSPCCAALFQGGSAPDALRHGLKSICPRLRQYASIGHRGLGQFDSAIIRPNRTNRAISRLPFRGNEKLGSVAIDLRLPPSTASLIDKPQYVSLTSHDHLRATQPGPG